MENNLYYTPTIEEFHVGFIYERKEYDDLRMIDEWYETSIDTPWQLVDYVMYLQNFNFNKTRVKYLDQEGIESLGWKDCDNIYNTIRWNFNDYILMFYKKDNRYLIFRDCGPNNIQTVFNGFIKNKSELIKLMQQLNIK